MNSLPLTKIGNRQPRNEESWDIATSPPHSSLTQQKRGPEQNSRTTQSWCIFHKNTEDDDSKKGSYFFLPIFIFCAAVKYGPIPICPTCLTSTKAGLATLLCSDSPTLEAAPRSSIGIDSLEHPLSAAFQHGRNDQPTQTTILSPVPQQPSSVLDFFDSYKQHCPVHC